MLTYWTLLAGLWHCEEEGHLCVLQPVHLCPAWGFGTVGPLLRHSYCKHLETETADTTLAACTNFVKILNNNTKPYAWFVSTKIAKMYTVLLFSCLHYVWAVKVVRVRYLWAHIQGVYILTLSLLNIPKLFQELERCKQYSFQSKALIHCM